MVYSISTLTAMIANMDTSQYFETARERYQIKLNREAGLPWPWTKDKHFQEWRFCQVHREDDKTTQWFRENVRDPLSRIVIDCPESAKEVNLLAILEATLIFRWFNRIETGKIIYDQLLRTDLWDENKVRERLKDVHPIVTGAYIIKCADGMSKLDGILYCFNQARPKLLPMVKKWTKYRSKENSDLNPSLHYTLKSAWEDLRTIDFMGGFTSYEVISDLRWTPLLETAPDIMTWANAGPGCARGLGWITHNDSDTYSTSAGSQRTMLKLMQEILERSKDPSNWPTEWRKWEMREAEHWCCEFDKYKRAESGERLKRRFNVIGV